MPRMSCEGRLMTGPEVDAAAAPARTDRTLARDPCVTLDRLARLTRWRGSRRPTAPAADTDQPGGANDAPGFEARSTMIDRAGRVHRRTGTRARTTLGGLAAC